MQISTPYICSARYQELKFPLLTANCCCELFLASVSHTHLIYCKEQSCLELAVSFVLMESITKTKFKQKVLLKNDIHEKCYCNNVNNKHSAGSKLPTD